MAIQNASDLLVYIKTGVALKQITRIKVLTTSPLSTTGALKINNVTNVSGQVFDDVATGSTSTNNGSSVLSIITNKLQESAYGYTISSESTQGDYTYRDVTNGGTGLVPTLEIINNTAILKKDSVVIEIMTPGSSDILDPVAFSTSASFSTNTDLIDVTTKDSEGCSESVSGLKSFELSTELLQNLNPDHPIDGTDFLNKLRKRRTYNISFSDRIRNIILTNLVKSGEDNFVESGLTQTLGQSDPFGGTTATRYTTGASTNSKYIRYALELARVEDKKLTLSFYVKGYASTTKASIFCNTPLLSVTKLSGDGTYSNGLISGLNTGVSSNPANWTRMEVTFDTSDMSSATSFYLYPGISSAQDSDAIETSSWQFELKGAATSYQDPTTITRWQGEALVTSIDFDAGVEDNLTCSATFTGTATNTLYT